MVNRLTIVLEQPEYSALLDLALRELRQPAAQVRYLVQQELQRQGYLSETDSAEPKQVPDAR